MKTKPFVTRANLAQVEEASPFLIDTLVYLKANGELLTVGFSCALMWASFLHARKVDFWIGPDMDTTFIKYSAATDTLEIEQNIEGITKDCMATFNYLCAVAAEKLTALLINAGIQAQEAQQQASVAPDTSSAPESSTPEVVPQAESATEASQPPAEVPAETPQPPEVVAPEEPPTQETVPQPEISIPVATELPPSVTLPAPSVSVAPVLSAAPDLSVQRAMLEQEEQGR